MRTSGPVAWIFQGNPDTFDVDGYLSLRTPRISWAVNQYGEEIREGDQVFLWRAAGRAKTTAGVVGRARVASAPGRGAPDPRSAPFWRDHAPGEGGEHVWLEDIELAAERRELRREWLKDDPVCRDLPIVKQAAGTNFKVPPLCLERLERLWERTGRDWTRADCIAALWAYDVTYGEPVSMRAGSIVTEVALRTGRAVSAVYNKVMNFRALDPRDERKGLAAGGQVDREVWDEFYETGRQVLDSTKLQRAYLDLWGDAEVGVSEDAPEPSGSLAAPVGESAPGRVGRTTYRMIRDTAITRWVKQLYDHRCQACGGRFDSPRGPVAEGAHIQPLGALHGGPDVVANVLCLCPTHHALFDRGAFAIADDHRILALRAEGLLDRLAVADGHSIGPEFLAYHRRRFARWPGWDGAGLE